MHSAKDATENKRARVWLNGHLCIRAKASARNQSPIFAKALATGSRRGVEYRGGRFEVCITVRSRSHF